MANTSDNKTLTLHGGGQGFESPRLHSEMCGFTGKSRLEQCYLDVRQILCEVAVQQHGPHIGAFVVTPSSLLPRRAARNKACGRRRPTS
jgi:hypothetical protein